MSELLDIRDKRSFLATSKQTGNYMSIKSLSFSGGNRSNYNDAIYRKMIDFITKKKPTDTSGHIQNITKIKIYRVDLSDHTDSAVWLPAWIEAESRIGKLVRVLGDFNITHLEMKGCSITDITSLADLSQLKTLLLGGNYITDIKGLVALTQLKTLDLRDNKIADIDGLAALTRLEDLNLGGNEITDIVDLAALKLLEDLNLRGNEITDISDLADLTRLKTLDLVSTEITDISDLAALTQLKTLDIGYNEIADIGILANLTQLEYLDLDGNKITYQQERICKSRVALHVKRKGLLKS